MILLIFLLFIILYIADLYIQKSFIAPSALLLLSFIMAIGLIAMNTENWDVVIYEEFTLYILSAVMAFVLGCFIMEIVCCANVGYGEQQIQDIEFGDNYPAVLLAFLSGVCGIAYLYLLTRDISFSGGISKALGTIYNRAVTGSTSNFVLHQMLEIVIAVSKISVFQLFIIKYFKKSKAQNAVILVPVLVSLACMVFSTDRNIILRYIIYAVCLWVLFYSNNIGESIRKRNWHIFKYAVVILAVVVALFYGLGKAKGYTSNFERMIGIYGGSGLYNFNIYLHNFPGTELQWGSSTFSTLQNTLRALGIIDGTAADTMVIDDMIIHASSNGYVYASNVYSAMRPYLDDFGYLGMFVYPFIMGAFFEMLYYLTQRMKYGFAWIFYAVMIYPAVYFTIAEQFYARLHLGLVYEIMWPLLFYLLIYSKIGVWKTRRSCSCV